MVGQWAQRLRRGQARAVRIEEESGEVNGQRLTSLTTKVPLLDDAGEVATVVGTRGSRPELYDTAPFGAQNRLSGQPLTFRPIALESRDGETPDSNTPAFR